MSFCQSCGSALNEGAKFCGVCGAAVPETPVAPAPEAAPEAAPAPAPAPAPAAEPIYVYKTIHEEPKKEPRKRMNFAALIIVTLTALLWMFAPLYGMPSSYDVFASMFRYGGAFQSYIAHTALALFPITSLFCWIFCAAFTLGKKMPPVRVFASISTGLSSILLAIQVLVSGRGLVGIGYGFWGFYLGTIVLICLGGTRYKKN